MATIFVKRGNEFVPQEANPLTQYYTYSYHHVLIGCDNTEVAEALQDSDELLTFLRTPEQVNTSQNPYGKYEARDYKNLGKYSIIINGMEDAEFVIRKAEWQTVTSSESSSDGMDKFSSMAVEGTIEIDEPRGIKFMNVLSSVANSLGSDPNGLIFLLKTVFIGHPAPGVNFNNQTGTEKESNRSYDPITNIRPIMFVMYDITGEFTVMGGNYEIAFMGVNHGATKQKHLLRSADRISINANDNSCAEYEGCANATLAGTLCKLERAVNVIYEAYYNRVLRGILNLKETDDRFRDFKGRKVRYIIEAESPYDSGDYKVDDFLQQNNDGGTEGEPGIIDLSSSMSVESAIMKIAQRCTKIKEDMVYGDRSGSSVESKYRPVVATTIQSTKDEYRVIYKLRRVLESRTDAIEKVVQRSSDDVNDQDDDIRRNIMEFDYLFTGRNTDIIDFDMRMEYGLVFFQTLVSTDTLTESEGAARSDTPRNQSANGQTTGSTKITPDKGQFLRPNTPIFLSTRFSDKLVKNTVQPKLSTDFQMLLNRHAALENLEAKLVIHGNPGLLNATNKAPSEIANQQNKNETKADLERDPFPYWETTPALIRVNVRMPADGEDQDFSEPFWYEGFYYCWAITHTFDDGMFTQTLEMISLPQSPVENVEQEGEEKEQTSGTTSAKSEEEEQERETGCSALRALREQTL